MEIFDAHADTISEIFDQEKSLWQNDLHIDAKRIFANGRYTQVFALFISPEYKNNAMARAKVLADRFFSETKKCGIDVCKSGTDFKCAKSTVKAVLSLEGGEPIEKIEDVATLYDMGVRIIAPTWNYRNKIACGVMEDEDTGLSAFGEKVIAEMERLGILCDVSHLSQNSFWDVVRVSKKPIVATHSNSYTIKNHPRNLTDDQFLAIKKSGGCVGINFYPPFLGDKIEDTILHIDRFLLLGGEDNIGIGSDFDGVDSLPKGICGCSDMQKFIKILPYTTEIKEKIAYKNFLRLLHCT